MLKKIKAILENAGRQSPVFDPTKFNDSLAMETEWSPLKGGGSNFRTHKLVQVDYSRIDFKSTLGAKVFSFIFMIVGVGIPVFIGFESFQENGGFFRSDFLFIVLFGLIFFAAGSWLFYTFAKPVIFDRTKGMYWKGWKAPKGYLAQDSVKEGSRIGNIHAIQILAEFVRGDKSSYYSYELNLVMKDGSRMNVIDHGSAIKIREDAKILSEFLGVPVWDVEASSEF
jgi:hypothetical protein